MKGFLRAALTALVCISGVASAQVPDLLLEVDLTVADTVTINATSGNSAATVSGSDTTGVYLLDFYGGSGSSLSASLVSGDLTNAANPTDNSPALFRAGSGVDEGLNIWSWSSDATVDFTSGALAFTGSASWTLSTTAYNEMLAGPTSGDLYFPADDIGDLGGATLIGTWSKILPAPPPPPPPAAPPAPPEPVPAVPALGLLLLAGGLLLQGRRALRKR